MTPRATDCASRASSSSRSRTAAATAPRDHRLDEADLRNVAPGLD
jgi:hypothetical protein